MPLEIKITDRCNIVCDYCYYKGGKPHSDLTFEDVISIIDYFIDCVIPDSVKTYAVTFFGGEPLLKKDLILNVVDHYQKADLNINLQFFICTNGVLLSSNVMNEFKLRSIGVYLSLDGPEHVHNINRKFKDGTGAFNMSADDLKNISGYCMSIEQVISPQTAEKLFESVKFLVENNFKKIIAMPDFTGNWTQERLEILKKQYEEIIKYKNLNTDFYYSIIDDKLRLINSKQSYKNHCCNFGRQTYVLATNKKIYPCTRFAQDLPDNNWDIGSLANGINWAKRAQLLSQHSHDRNDCMDCSIKNICLGNCCACISFSLSMGINYVSPLVCEHERMVFELLEKHFFQDYI